MIEVSYFWATLLFVYLLINAFSAGIYWKEKWGVTDRLNTMFWTLGTLFLGIPYFICIVLYVILDALMYWIDDYTQFRFWFVYYLGNGYKDFPIEDLKRINRVALRKSKTIKNSYKKRLYIHCVELVNKANNYTYDENEH